MYVLTVYINSKPIVSLTSLGIGTKTSNYSVIQKYNDAILLYFT